MEVQGFQKDPHDWQNLPEMPPANMQRNRNSSGKAMQKSRSKNYLLNLSSKNMIFQIMEFAQMELNTLPHATGTRLGTRLGTPRHLFLRVSAGKMAKL